MSTLPLRSHHGGGFRAPKKTPLLNQTAPASKSLRSSHNRASRKDDEAKEVEKEYIYNLQQQIYFLELELKFLHERENDQDHEKDSAAAPLVDLVESLKAKCSDMQRTYEQELYQVKQSQQSFEQQQSTQQYTIAQLEDEKRSVLAQINQLTIEHAEQRQERQREIVRIGKENEKLKLDSQKAIAERDHLQQEKEKILAEKLKFEAMLRDLETEATACKAEHDALSQRASKVDEEYQRLQVRFNDMQQDYKTNAGSCSAEEEEQLKSDLAAAQLKVKKLDLQYQQLQDVKDVMEHRLNAMAQENVALAERVIALEKQLQTERNRHELHDTLGENIRLKTAINESAAQLTQALMRSEARKQEIVGLEQEIQAIKLRSSGLEAQLYRAQQAAEADKAHYAQVDIENEQLQQENLALKEEAVELRRFEEQRREKLENLQNNNIEMRAKIDMMTKKLKRCQDIESLNLGEFQGLMNSNTQVASNLEHFVEVLKETRDVPVPDGFGGTFGSGSTFGRSRV